MDEQRALMDQLMGANRDLPPEEAAKRKRNFWDSDIDKNFLCGLCPALLFKNTKSETFCKEEEGVCDDSCKKDWEALPQEEKDKWGYEYDLMMSLEDLIAQCDKQIQANKQRIEKAVELSEVNQARVDAINAEVKEKTILSESLGEKGEVVEAQAVMKEIETLLTEKANIQLGLNNPASQGAQREKKLFVCEVSGNFLCSTDNEQRLRNHFSGKIYRGWQAVREKYAELKAKNPPRVASRNRPKRPSSQEERERDKEREKDREKRREREKRRDKSRSRERKRSKSRERKRSRSREKRSRSRDRRRR